ncbi:MAG: hypothetical protein NZM08_06160, partial [Chitinophagales bacterium]|nr:hypothetical protein [Chitinophagales bacterium]
MWNGCPKGLQRIYRFAIGTVVMLAFLPATAQIAIDTSLSAELLVNRLLVGDGIVVRNISFQGRPGSLGWFA